MRRGELGLVMMLAVLLAFSTSVLADESRLDEPVRLLLEKADNQDFIPVTVVMRDRPDLDAIGMLVEGLPRNDRSAVVWEELTKLASSTQSELLNFLDLEERKGTVKDIRSIKVINSVAIKAHPAIIEILSERNDIWMIVEDEEEHALPPQPDIPINELDEIAWGVSQINAPDVWDDGYTGEGVLVAVIDTGVRYTHNDLEDHVWDGGEDYPNHGWDFYNNDNNPMDDHGHGTHCSGTVCGDGTSGDQTGVAPDATLMCLKVLSSGGNGQPSQVWDAMDFCIEQGVDVTSISLGWHDESNANRALWRQTYDASLVAGIVSCIAAGNERGWWYDPPDVLRTPGDVPSPWRHPDEIEEGSRSGVVTVGATNQNDGYADFSSNGPVTWENVPGYDDYPYNNGANAGLIAPDIAAPGVDIWSCSNNGDSGYQYMSGTSMATPHMAGVVCLMFSKAPLMMPVEVDSVLQNTAIDLGPEGKDNDYGAGRVDAYAAVDGSFAATGWIQGAVINANDDTPIEGAIVTTLQSGRRDTSDASGEFFLELPVGTYTVVVNYPPFLPYEQEDVVVDSAQINEFDIFLGVGLFGSSPEELSVTLQGDTTHEEVISILNNGSGPMDVHLKVLPVIETDEFLDQIFSFNGSADNGDNRLNAVEFGNGMFFVTGSNNTSNPNYIYKYDETGQYLGSFIQPGSDEPDASSNGMRDLAFDGEFLYGSYDRTIYVMDTETGEAVTSFNGPLSPNRNLAYDPELDALWICDQRTEIVAFDLETHEVVQTLEAIDNLYVSGLAIYGADDDGYNLYLGGRDNDSDHALYKYNYESGEYIKVADLPDEEDRDLFGLTIVESFQTYYSGVFGVLNTPGGDMVTGWELSLSVEWASVDQDFISVEPQNSVDVTVTFDSHDQEVGEYNGYIRARHNTAEGESTIPLTMIVDVDPVGSDDEDLMPKEFKLSNPFPNPFNNKTVVSFAVPERHNVSLTVYDILGREVAKIHKGMTSPGTHSVVFDGSSMSSGIYFIRMDAGSEYQRIAKLVLLK